MTNVNYRLYKNRPFLVRGRYDGRSPNFKKDWKKILNSIAIFLILSVLLISLIEYVLNFLTKYAKKKFQWLIDYEDETPKFDKKRLNKFFKESFDPELGWIRKPGTSGIEFNYKGSSKFKISKNGSRFNPSNKFKSTKIATFGDSFTFCRQVNDHQTWQSHLAKNLKTNVLNFGVGNYGLDQSYLKYRKYRN